MDEEKPPDSKIKIRGTKVLLPHGGLPEIISRHLLNLIARTGGANGPIGRQFISQPEKERRFFKRGVLDPLSEDEHEVAPGLVYKYKGRIKNGQIIRFGRALWTITRFCGSYCRFCTRGREVGLPVNSKPTTKATLAKKPFLGDSDIGKVLNYLSKHKEINEVILSGGDPFASPKSYLTKIILALSKLQKKEEIDIVRIGTRLPVHNPSSIQDWHYKLVSKIKNPYILVHINHPEELTKETIAVLDNFRNKTMASILSQTVLLKDVNDNEKTLYQLFYKMVKFGIRPYYVYQNDPVYWARHFTVPIKHAIKIWENLRPKLSGLAATARFVIDAPFGYGKIPIPEGKAWKVDYDSYIDFRGKKHKTVLD